MSLTVSIIAKLSWTDPELARRALATAESLDDANAAPPTEFRHGRAARCYALAVMAAYRPGRLWLGLASVVVIPVLLLIKIFY